MSGSSVLTSSSTTRGTAAPALYDAEVRHVRRKVLDRAFTHRIYLWLVDLDALPQLPRWLRPFARFQARDHLGDAARSIRENLDAYLETQGVDVRGGQVLMLANARLLGYVFNPITVYWCHRQDGELECVVAEVHNTYGERHCYLLRTDDAGRARTAKDFYVSPFLTVDGEYQMVLPVPDERLAIAVTLRQSSGCPSAAHGNDDPSTADHAVGGHHTSRSTDAPPVGCPAGDGAPRTALTATVLGVRRPVTPRSLAAMLVRRPLITYRTSALIRRHGIALWLRRLPVIPRPRHVPQRRVQ